MKNIVLFIGMTFISSAAFAQDEAFSELSLNDLYRSVDKMAEYVHRKDSAISEFDAFQLITKNIEEKGIEHAIIIPAERFRQNEVDPQNESILVEAIINLGKKPKPKTPPKRNIDIVANSKECMSKCIDDVLSGAANGATVGGAIGAGGGPATAGAGAAGGAVVGGALGGVRCSLSKECDDKKKNKFVMPENEETKRIEFSYDEYAKIKRDMVVNDGGGWSRNGF